MNKKYYGFTILYKENDKEYLEKIVFTETKEKADEIAKKMTAENEKGRQYYATKDDKTIKEFCF